MIPFKTKSTNCILKGPTPDVMDLPVTRFQLENDIPAVQSCWELSKEEIDQISKTGKIYFCYLWKHTSTYLFKRKFYRRGR